MASGFPAGINGVGSARGPDNIADASIRALVRHDRKAWRDSVIVLAGSPEAKYRRKALYYLGIFEVHAAAPLMREATASPDREVRKTACEALRSLKQPQPAA
jgi:HEAT repeat protein